MTCFGDLRTSTGAVLLILASAPSMPMHASAFTPTPRAVSLLDGIVSTPNTRLRKLYYSINGDDGKKSTTKEATRTIYSPFHNGFSEITFDDLVNKNEKGARQDIEARSERISLDISKTTYTSLVKSAPDAYITFAEKGASNALLPKMKTFHQSIMGGCYVGFGGLISLSIAGNLGGIAAANPGVAKMAFAALFPVNLLLIMSTSAQLFTGNSATVAAARFEGFITWKDLWTNWAVSLTGNVVGCGLFAAAAVASKILNPGSAALTISSAVGKCSVGLAPIIIRAIMCNWMVSMAVFLCAAANDLTGKMVGCWFPISTFVGIGLEHSVANLFILPLALMLGAPTITLKTIIMKNLIPVIVGNAIAGFFIVAGSYSYQFGRLGGLRRAMFAEKLANIQKELELKRRSSRIKEWRLQAANSVK